MFSLEENEKVEQGLLRTNKRESIVFKNTDFDKLQELENKKQNQSKCISFFSLKNCFCFTQNAKISPKNT
jgi:hypothetical protein